MLIRPAQTDDLPILTDLALQLWSEHDRQALLTELQDLLISERAQFFLAYESDQPVGFAQCQLRSDYVEGTESSPVGYLEGIFVSPAHRHKGCARMLLDACERWALKQGCTEFASDCELDNAQSLAMHRALGFEEANRIICFTKKLQA